MTSNGGGSGALSGGSSIALGTAATGSGAALGGSTGVRMGTVIRVGAGVGVGGFSRSKVIGARYCTTLRTVCITGVDCNTSHKSARCKTPAVITAGIDRRGLGSRLLASGLTRLTAMTARLDNRS
ncbi:hypothetical protein [Rhodoferax sp.]|uniref:hypothetical protein n=1 Tax=Rhodoferax sp. TaxID=50421 RepID=UPI00374DE1AD